MVQNLSSKPGPTVIIFAGRNSEGLHRSVAQIKARAPHAGLPYISTESRLSTFHALFENPLAVAELAAKHSDLTSTRSLAREIAHLVGGPACIPGRALKHAELTQLLYSTTFKFSRGSAVAEQIADVDTDANTLRKNKQKLALEQKTSISPFRLLLVDHFRRISSPGSFYSLPASIFNTIPGTEITEALQAGIEMPASQTSLVPWLTGCVAWSPRKLPY